MINFEELAQAMGDLDEDTMLKLLDPPARKEWTP